MNTLGKPKPYDWVGVSGGALAGRPVITGCNANVLKLKRPGKFNSKVALTSMKLKSAPNLVVWFPTIQLTLLAIWIRSSVRSTGENGLDPMNAAPEIWRATLGI